MPFVEIVPMAKRKLHFLELTAPAKVNLTLRIHGKRDDGFHGVTTRMCRLSLGDEIVMHRLEDHSPVEFTCSDPTLSTGEENLVMRALRALEIHTGQAFPVRIELRKFIPSAAGLGGGSSDAATTLMGLNRLFDLHLDTAVLGHIAATFGSDIPFFLHENTCDCSGRGEQIDVVPFPWELPIVLAKPGFGVSAGEAYQRWASAAEIPGIFYGSQWCPWGEMINDLERPVFSKYLILARLKAWFLSQLDVQAALMCGSGSTVMAIPRRFDCLGQIEERLREAFGKDLWIWTGHTLASGVAG